MYVGLAFYNSIFSLLFGIVSIFFFISYKKLPVYIGFLSLFFSFFFIVLTYSTLNAKFIGFHCNLYVDPNFVVDKVSQYLRSKSEICIDHIPVLKYPQTLFRTGLCILTSKFILMYTAMWPLIALFPHMRILKDILYREYINFGVTRGSNNYTATIRSLMEGVPLVPELQFIRVPGRGLGCYDIEATFSFPTYSPLNEIMPRDSGISGIN